MKRVVFEFADSETVERFLAWLADGGGEQDFFASEKIHGGEIHVQRFDYSRAFPAWGYDPGKHGDDRIVVAVSGKPEIP